jgi:hypothetical protein
MLSMEQRTVMRFFTLKKFNLEDIHTEFLSMYGPNALAFSTVYKWNQRFVDGRTEICDDLRSRRSLSHDLAEALNTML